MMIKVFKKTFTVLGLAVILLVLAFAGMSVTASADTVYYGDVNNDGVINALDASAVLRHSIGSAVLEGNAVAAADVDGSGQINAVDATLILRYSVGSITQLPAGFSFETDTSENGKILVAYFSATNTTEGVAMTLADQIGADLYEITPAIPYTSADLNYNSDTSRTTIEMNDPNSRPSISRTVDNMAQYDVVFIGYPIWWGEAPRIINTFVESYDFSEKTVVPFCTSGGSGIGSSGRILERLTNGANWLDGRRFSGSVTANELADWVNGLDLS